MRLGAAKDAEITRIRATLASQLATSNSLGASDVYEVRPRKDKRGVDLISDAVPFGPLWYGEPNAISNAIGWQSFAAAHIAL